MEFDHLSLEPCMRLREQLLKENLLRKHFLGFSLSCSALLMFVGALA